MEAVSRGGINVWTNGRQRCPRENLRIKALCSIRSSSLLKMNTGFKISITTLYFFYTQEICRLQISINFDELAKDVST